MKKFAAAACTALGLLSAPVQAAPFTIEYQDPTDPFGAGALFSPIEIDSAVFDGTFRAGQFELSINGIEDILAFCIEVTQGLRNGLTYDEDPNLFSTAVIDNIDRLFTSAYDLVVDGISAAAFQVALWEITEDTALGLDLTSGTFITPSNADASQQQIRQTATTFLNGLASASTGGFDIRLLASPDSQDVVTFERAAVPSSSRSPSPVPLPASGLLLLSAGGLLMVRRKTT